MLWYVIYDSDGNPVAATGRPEHIGTLIAEHYALVDRTPGADEPFLTVQREVRLGAHHATNDDPCTMPGCVGCPSGR